MTRIYLNTNGALEIRDDSVIRTLSGSGHTARWDLTNEMFSIDGGVLKPLHIDEVQDENGDPYATFSIFKGAIDPFFVKATGLGGFIDLIYSGDDKGVIVKQELQVGSPENPKESTFGEGDSYPIPLAFHYDGVSTYTNVTEILASDTASTTGFFGGTSTGNTIMAMSIYSYGGIKVKMDTIGDVAPDNIVAEYLDATGTWRSVNFMIAEDSFIYDQSANNILSCSTCHEQIHFDPTLILTYPWGERTLNINGTDYTGYWSRFRITAPIVSDAVVEQIKLSTNRLEIAEDGQIMKRGRQRIATYYPLPIEYRPIVGATPSDTNVNWADVINIVGVDNTLADNKTDSFAVKGTIAEGIDTSIPLKLRLRWYATASDGNTEAIIDYAQIKLGDPINGTVVSERSTKIIPIAAGDEYKWSSVEFDIAVNKLSDGDKFIIKISRDSTVGNTNDTLAGSIVITDVAVLAARWKL